MRMMRWWCSLLLSLLVVVIGGEKLTDAIRLSPSSGSNRWLLREQGLAFLAVSSDNGRNVLRDEDVAWNIRGGGGVSDDDDNGEEYDDESDFDFFDDDDDDDMMFDEDMMMDEDDAFGEDSTVARLLESWQKTPPFTKAYLSASIGATMLGYLTQKNHEFPPYFSLEWKMVLTRFHVWRPLTAFLNFGSLGIGYLLTLNFVWTYMSTLERLNHDHPYDFWYMILFGCMSMVTGYACLGLSPRFLGHNLSTFLVYVWSRYHEGLEVNMFELFNSRAEMLPWFFLAQTFLLEGELPILDLLGIVFGHVYYHLKHCKMLITPACVVNWYHNSPRPFPTAIRNKYKEISSDYEI